MQEAHAPMALSLVYNSLSPLSLFFNHVHFRGGTACIRLSRTKRREAEIEKERTKCQCGRESERKEGGRMNQIYSVKPVAMITKG